MKNMKKLLAAVLALTLLAGCAQGGAAPSEDTPNVRTETLSTTGTPSGLPDVPAGVWYAEAVNWCLEQGLIDPASASAFAPSSDSNRATLAAALYRAAGSPAVSVHDFPDIPADSWYAEAAAWAKANNMIAGYDDGRFGGEDPVTREQAVTILWRRSGSPTPEASQDFTDEGAISPYAAQAVDWSRANGIISGNPDGSFNPQGHITRAQIAQVLYQYLKVDAPSSGIPQVLMTTDISPEGLMAIYEALGWSPAGKVAVKLSTGEPPASNYLRPELIKDVVQAVDGTIVECNTAYGGSRASTAMHYQVARDHGFTEIADVDIMDENGSMTLSVAGGENLTENYVGANFSNYDSFLVLSHFKGHAMAGFGGAIKNISIGIASSEGKCWIHSGGTSRTNAWGGEQDAFLESMAEAGKSVAEALDGKIVYINVMNRLSVDCDCDGNPAEPDMHDIGILASYDPVALDQACVDLIYAQKDGDGASLVNRIESRNGLHTLEHAEKIGLGSRAYQLVSIDRQGETGGSRQIKLTVAGQECIATLYDNPSADDLYNSLPLELTFEDYNQTEKISHPPKTLSTEGMPDTFDPDVGDLCLYAPWGNLCIFYRDFRESTSLIPLGHIDNGMDVIGNITENFIVTMEVVK